jgi:ubiquinone/menaquinone biosynthesis C-methylase UbiE
MMTEIRDTGLSREIDVKQHFSRRSAYWDSLYNKPEGPHAFTKYELKRRQEIVFDLVGIRSGGAATTALDLGCGPGQYMVHLSRLGFDCCGADISEEMLQIAREKIPASPFVKWIHSDCRNVPVEDQFFDLILCIGVLEYLSDDLSGLQEIQRLIKPSGGVILTFPNLYKLRNILNPYYYMVRIWTYLFVRKSSQRSPDTTEQLGHCKSTERRYSLRHVHKLAADAGFQLMDVRSCCFGPFSLWKKEMLPLSRTIKISTALEGLQRHRGFGFLRFFANRWVLLLQPANSDRLGHCHPK